MGLTLKKSNNRDKLPRKEADFCVSNEDLKRMISTIELKPLTKEEILKSRMNAYQPVY